MYASVDYRTRNVSRLRETGELAQQEHFPKMRQAKGFLSFCVISEADGNLAITLWESKQDADAFEEEAEPWRKTLNEHGHHHRRTGGGEVAYLVTPDK